MTSQTPEHIETRHFINNEFVPSISGKTFKLFNPATEEKLVDVCEGDENDVDAAVEAAKVAFKTWKDTPASVRGDLLRKLGQLISKNTGEIAYLDAVTMGGPSARAPFLLNWVCGTIFNQCAGFAEAIRGVTSLTDGTSVNMTIRQPYGVCAGVIPWNAPIIMTIMKVAPAVGAGNCIIIKSSEKAPLSPLVFARCVKEAGFPPGVIQILNGPGSVGAALASHMDIRKISFTGSVRTGKIISELAAKSNLKKVTLELGGKSPVIIFPDADLDKAVAKVAFGFVGNSGQVCISTNRVYVHEDVVEEFTKKTQTTHRIDLYPRVLGPLVDEIQYGHVMKFIQEGKKSGAKVISGGDRPGGKGYFVQPTIFREVAEDSYVMKVESFGPIAQVNSFSTEEEVIAKANNTEYGLYSSVFTNDLNRALRLAKEIDAGTVVVNAASPTASLRMPFGGWKQSGNGVECGPEGFDLWTQIKTIIVATE